jgi:hypothetical protein
VKLGDYQTQMNEDITEIEQDLSEYSDVQSERVFNPYGDGRFGMVDF